MAPRKPIIAASTEAELARRARLAELAVLIADRDRRTASLVHRVLFSFGFGNMDIITNAEKVVEMLRERRYDMIITEWNMEPLDGLSLVKAIRRAQADQRIPRDIPIIMLTARTDLDSVKDARDAGITEFVAKPFSAKTLSTRIIQIIDSPRSFVDTLMFVGPDRRRRPPPSDMPERRVRNEGVTMPPNDRIRQQLGEFTAADLLNDRAIADAQNELMKAEEEFVDWAKSDILRLRRAYQALTTHSNNLDAKRELLDAAYAIHTLSGVFGYRLGTEVAQLLTAYLKDRKAFNDDNLLVISKYIDTIATVFTERLKNSSEGIDREMLESLKMLTQKLG